MQHGRNRKRNVDRDADSSPRRSTREGCVQHNGQLRSVIAVADSGDEPRSLFTYVQEVSDVCDVTQRRRNRRRRSSTNSGSRDRRRRRGVSSSTSDDNRSGVHRHRVRLRNFDGSGSFESFWAHSRNCATYNRWSNADKLAHLKAALTGDAGQVLWDTDDTEIDTVDKSSTLLCNRYGGTRQADKYRMELRLRRRRYGESLSNLHQDIRRLMALAHQSLPHEARETIACDYYIDALGDADLALKVRERVPASLHDALRVSLQLEAWQKDTQRYGQDSFGSQKSKVRGASQVVGADDKQ